MSDPDFIDECTIYVCAGDGGRGCVSFRREKYVPRGGPNGGNGGRGGSIVFVGDSGMSTLFDARHRKHYKAQRGAHGQGARKNGRSGRDILVHLPLGTVVREASSGLILHELLSAGENWIAAQGGAGGRGNACFATSTRQAPGYAEPGISGEERWLRLELKVLADVGLLGFPNAGKSTLISRVSAARPRIAAYPFTTLRPHLGMVEVGEARFVLADIPGLIPGAHLGVGLGHRFLRHVERTKLLVHLLDPEPALRREQDRSLSSDYRRIREELRAYSPELDERPELVCIAKADLVPDPEQRRLLCEENGLSGRWISAATGEGIQELVRELGQRLAKHRAQETAASEREAAPNESTPNP